MKRAVWIAVAAFTALAACGDGTTVTTSAAPATTTSTTTTPASGMTLAGLTFEVHQEPG